MRKINGRFGAVARITALMGMMLAAAIAAPAQTLKTLVSFDTSDGGFSYGRLLQATDGNLYGTTYDGGDGCGDPGCGVVFRMTPNGNVTTLHRFCSLPGCADGGQPWAPLIQGTDGNFYGTTTTGGANISSYGTVFRITASGELTTLYNFCSRSRCIDGSFPTAALVQASDGNFYGTTGSGGARNGGTFFKITANGALTPLYSFCSITPYCMDGQQPYGTLIQGDDGNFYGTTGQGGGPNDGGTVFKVTPQGALTTLYSFCSKSGCSDGSSPFAGLVQDISGNFYGTTPNGGAYSNGTVFQITAGGTLTTLYSFCAQPGCTDGSYPFAALLESTDGNLYGTTAAGGSTAFCITGCGTVFRIDSGGAFTSLYSSCSESGCIDGSNPWAALLQDTNGKLYGTTAGGGANSWGTVFGLSLGLHPFVKTNPLAGAVGEQVIILGTGLTGATSVTFNGTPAAFTVKSASAIKTSVPAGATTGPVQVVTPTGTLTSNVNFQVLP